MSSNASVVYTYTGNSFTNIQDNDPPAGTFTTSDFVSISFIVPELLTDLRLPILISPTSFTASNGRITLTNTSPLTLETIRVATDSSGLITGWHISLAKGDSDLQVGEQSDQIFTGFNTAYGAGDGGNRTECTERDGADEQCFNFLVDFGSNTTNPGTWSVSTNVVSGSLWDEGVIGDFNAGQLFTLTEGDNWFIGTQAWANDPIDGFRFTVPEGYQATIDVDYEYLNLGEAEGICERSEAGRKITVGADTRPRVLLRAALLHALHSLGPEIDPAPFRPLVHHLGANLPSVERTDQGTGRGNIFGL